MTRIPEIKENEQYFFDAPTVEHLADFAEMYEHPCILCAPTLGRELVRRGKTPAILDIDERFQATPGFRKFDIKRPVYTSEVYDIVIVDPPFFNVSLSQLFHALRVLTHYDFEHPVLVTYLARRAHAFKAAMKPFKFEEVGFAPQYESVVPGPKNDIVFFANFDAPLGVNA